MTGFVLLLRDCPVSFVGGAKRFLCAVNEYRIKHGERDEPLLDDIRLQRKRPNYSMQFLSRSQFGSRWHKGHARRIARKRYIKADLPDLSSTTACSSYDNSCRWSNHPLSSIWIRLPSRPMSPRWSVCPDRTTLCRTTSSKRSRLLRCFARDRGPVSWIAS